MKLQKCHFQILNNLKKSLNNQKIVIQIKLQNKIISSKSLIPLKQNLHKNKENQIWKKKRKKKRFKNNNKKQKLLIKLLNHLEKLKMTVSFTFYYLTI